MDCDVVVIGGGPGGYVAAVELAKNNKNVVLINKGPIGGTCVNVGCIPTKSILSNVENIDYNGSSQEEVLTDLRSEKNQATEEVRRGIEYLMRSNRVSVIDGTASFVNKNTLLVKKEDEEFEIKAENIIIATGSVHKKIQFEGSTLPNVVDSTQALELSFVPKKLLVAGGGAVGVEIAYAYNKLGSKVKIVEMQKQLLPWLDTEIAEMYQEILMTKGIEIILEATLSSISETDNDLLITLDKNGEETEESADVVLLALGREPATADLNCDNAGIILDRGTVPVDESTLKTIQNGIYAIGDVNGRYQLAHVASMEGRVTAAQISGDTNFKMSYDAVPNCIYTTPEIASVGLTEQQLNEKARSYAVYRWNTAKNGKATATNEKDGMIKILVCQDTGEVLGVHILNSVATEIIGLAVYAIRAELTVDILKEIMLPHPSLSESFFDALYTLPQVITP